MTTVLTNEERRADTTTDNKVLFWGCFVALITTAFGFIARMFLIDTWAREFELDPAQSGRLAGIGIWPFAFSIIGFSLVIDKIGYKMSMILAFLGHMIWAVMGVSAYFLSHHHNDKETAYQLLYWGSLVLALGNGTVEAFINPVVATMFSREKTKWLNILHAGWPGGLVVAGMMTIGMDWWADAGRGEGAVNGPIPWWIKVGIIAVPAVLYFLMLLPCRFPVQERVASGVSYRQMLSEFGILGAAIVGILVALQLMDFFSNGGTRLLPETEKYLYIGIGAAIVIAFGVYTQSLGRFLMFFLILIMMPLATTEIGTDGWITGIMEPVAKANRFHPGWILVYTSAIMMVLRFFAGPIVHQLSPLGLLATSAVLAIIGLYTLSSAEGAMIFLAATLYGFGKTFFWPTMLGVVSEQTPRGGAVTLNAISGIGMLAVGTLGFPYIGMLQADKEIAALQTADVSKQVPGLVEGGKLSVIEQRKAYEIPYEAISETKLKELIAPLAQEQRKDVSEKIEVIRGRSKQGALLNMTLFPLTMLIGYLALIVYFRARGGYQAQVLVGHAAEDAKFTGGVEGSVEG